MSADAAARHEETKPIHIGIRSTHPLAKAAMLLAVPFTTGAIAYNLAMTDPSQQEQALVAFLVAATLIVGIPVVVIAWVHIGRGLPAFVSNSIAYRLLPNASHVFHTRTGLKLYADATKGKYAVGSRTYAFADVSEVDYATPFVRVRSRRGQNAIESFEVGNVSACEQWMRAMCQMVGIEY